MINFRLIDIFFQNIYRYISNTSVKSKYRYIRDYRYFHPWGSLPKSCLQSSRENLVLKSYACYYSRTNLMTFFHLPWRVLMLWKSSDGCPLYPPFSLFPIHQTLFLMVFIPTTKFVPHIQSSQNISSKNPRMCWPFFSHFFSILTSHNPSASLSQWRLLSIFPLFFLPK